MEQLNPNVVEHQLQQWVNRLVYVHLEVNPGAYWRNGSAVLTSVHVKGSGHFRVFLEFDGGRGLIHVDDLTHMSVDEQMVICTGYDNQDRLARTIEVSLQPFPMTSLG